MTFCELEISSVFGGQMWGDQAEETDDQSKNM